MTDPPAHPRDSYAGLSANNPGSELTDEEVEFGRAVHDFQVRYHRRYPAWSDILFVLRSLGYRKQTPIQNGNAEDADSSADDVDVSGLKGRFRQPRP